MARPRSLLTAVPESESVLAWRSLSVSYVKTHNSDSLKPAVNCRRRRRGRRPRMCAGPSGAPPAPEISQQGSESHPSEQSARSGGTATTRDVMAVGSLFSRERRTTGVLSIIVGTDAPRVWVRCSRVVCRLRSDTRRGQPRHLCRRPAQRSRPLLLGRHSRCHHRRHRRCSRRRHHSCSRKRLHRPLRRCRVRACLQTSTRRTKHCNR